MPLHLPSSLPQHPGLRTGAYYGSHWGDIGSATAVAAANTLYAQPFFAPGASINRIGVEVTAAVAGNCRVGLAANNGGLPGSLILDAGALDTGAAGVKEATVNLALPSDWVWLLCVFDAAPTMRRLIGGCTWWSGSASPALASGTSLSAALTYGALPSTMPAGTYTLGTFPAVYVRKV